MFGVNMTFISSSEVKKCIFLYFIEWSEKMYISWVPSEVKKCIFHECRRNIHFFTSLDEIKVIFTPNIWIFFLLYTSLSIEEMQILQNLSCSPLTINGNKKKSSSGSYIFYCSEEWKYKFYIFTSENITFSKYAFYFINNSLYFIALYIIKNVLLLFHRAYRFQSRKYYTFREEFAPSASKYFSLTVAHILEAILGKTFQLCVK